MSCAQLAREVTNPAASHVYPPLPALPCRLTYEVREPNQTRKNGTVHYRNPRFQGYGDNFSVKRKGIPTGGLISEKIGDKNKKK